MKPGFWPPRSLPSPSCQLIHVRRSWPRDRSIRAPGSRPTTIRVSPTVGRLIVVYVKPMDATWLAARTEADTDARRPTEATLVSRLNRYLAIALEPGAEVE